MLDSLTKSYEYDYHIIFPKKKKIEQNVWQAISKNSLNTSFQHALKHWHGERLVTRQSYMLLSGTIIIRDSYLWAWSAQHYLYQVNTLFLNKLLPFHSRLLSKSSKMELSTFDSPIFTLFSSLLQYPSACDCFTLLRDIKSLFTIPHPPNFI